MSRRLKFSIVFLAVLGVVYGGVRLWRASNDIPRDFVDARLQGALIAQNIVNLSNQSVGDINKINELDKEGNYTEALNLTTSVINQSAEIRNQAVALSSQIERMIKGLSDINSLDARQAALEAISSRLALLSRLINYSGYLGQLLDVLRSRFVGGPSHNQEVQTVVTQINSEVAAINNFNNQATQAMNRFDNIVGR